MKALMRLAAKLYPSAWRERYGDEFDALIEDSGATWPTAFDVWKGAMAMQLRSKSGSWVVGAFSVVPIALAATLATSPNPAAKTQISGYSASNKQINDTAQRLLSPKMVQALIERHHLEPGATTEDGVQRVKRRIRIRPGNPSGMWVGFEDPSPVAARAVVADVSQQFGEALHGTVSPVETQSRHHYGWPAFLGAAGGLMAGLLFQYCFVRRRLLI